MRKKTYAEMRREGLCPGCGKPNPTPDKCRCPDCKKRGNELRRQNAAYRRKTGMCQRCGKHEAEPNKTLCYECIGEEQDRYREKARTDGQREKDRKKKRQLKEKRLADGLCPCCGKQSTIDGGLCGRCRGYLYLYRQKNRNDISREERTSYGLCYICGKPVMEGKKVCSKCYGTRLSTMPAMWKNMDNSYFRSSNTLYRGYRNGKNHHNNRRAEQAAQGGIE